MHTFLKFRKIPKFALALVPSKMSFKAALYIGIYYLVLQNMYLQRHLFHKSLSQAEAKKYIHDVKGPHEIKEKNKESKTDLLD